MATLNVGTLREKVEEIVDLMEKRKIDIMGVSETRMKDCGNKTVYKDYKLIYSGRNNGRHGVALIVNNTLADRITFTKQVNERVIGISLKIGENDLDVVQIYAPQQGRPTAEKEEFYQTLEDTIDAMPHKESMIIMGDFNGHVGVERGEHYWCNWNRG